VRQILGAEDRNAVVSAPGVIEQQPGGDGRDIAVAQVGSLRSPEIGAKNMPWVLIGSTWRRTLSINEGSVSAR